MAEEFTVKIILPEGASDISVNLPYDMEHSEREVYKYLDMRPGGRKEITFSKRNVITDFHNKDVTITYRISALDHWFKPVILIFYVFCVFLFMILTFSGKSKVKND